MDSSEVTTNQVSMRLRAAFLHWAVCLGAFVVLVVAASSLSSRLLGSLAFWFYFGTGLYLSRAVLRKIVEWHPMYDTLYNVTSAKLKFFFFWPVMYFFLFARLGVNKVL